MQDWVVHTPVPIGIRGSRGPARNRTVARTMAGWEYFISTSERSISSSYKTSSIRDQLKRNICTRVDVFAVSGSLLMCDRDDLEHNIVNFEDFGNSMRF